MQKLFKNVLRKFSFYNVLGKQNCVRGFSVLNLQNSSNSDKKKVLPQWNFLRILLLKNSIQCKKVLISLKMLNDNGHSFNHEEDDGIHIDDDSEKNVLKMMTQDTTRKTPKRIMVTWIEYKTDFSNGFSSAYKYNFLAKLICRYIKVLICSFTDKIAIPEQLKQSNI